ncbi:hypothetical protein MMYC01_201707 [Madurella mycetomatis]|uniref:Rhodopsin domain-containing protein n=1 Tax=Madurella mycetomatis TaxID=100816 RepID=A0A175WEV4_9PEZI|nr:hypothetical protein MMYC01_201707 [Madurella mycetomatis]
MRLPPPEVMATWPAPNYIDPETRGPALLIVQFITLPIALLCLALRLYVKLSITRKSGWDDWLMVAAAIFGIGLTLCVILATSLYGWNIHVWDLTVEDIVSGRRVSFIAQCLFIPATAFAKVSILISYLRLAPLDSWFRRLTYASLCYVILSSIAFFLSFSLSACNPTSSYWDIFGSNRNCIPEGPPLVSHAVATLAADFAVWIIPLPALYKARLPLLQRIALIILFSFGSLVVVAACIRTYWVHYVIEETFDVTWEGFHLWIWTAVEVHLGMVCGCVPWLKSLFNLWKTKRAGVAGPAAGSEGRRRSDARMTWRAAAT